MTLLYHSYDRQPDGTLLCPMTGQSLTVRHSGSDGLACHYQDRDLSETFTARFCAKDDYYGLNLLVDWSQPNAGHVRNDYGRWRRITWFLLDVLLVWLREEQRPERSVLVLGGWLGGAFIRQARFMSSCWFDEGGRDRLVEEVQPYAIQPIGVSAPIWRYEPGLEGTREGEIAILDQREGGLPLADLSKPIADQLAQVPRFVADDGTIFFFHRVVPHVGPEYAPGIEHGLATQDFAFYFSGGHGSLRGKPIRLRPEAEPRQAVLQEAIPDYMQRDLGSNAHRDRLHPMLREQQYFAGSEAQALLFDVPYDQLPTMRSLEHDQDHRFGSQLSTISDPPMSVGLTFSQLTALPRLSTEPNERIRGVFARREEEERARRWSAFMRFRERLGRGEIPMQKGDR